MQAAIAVALTYPLQPGTRHIDDTLALSVYALDPDARVRARSTRQLRFAGSAPARPSVPLLLDDVVELPTERLTIRVGVASRQLGRAGTVQLPLDVVNPSDGALQLSGIAIGVAGPTPPALNAAAIAPLVPFQPTTTRAFAGQETLRVFGRVFWRGGEPPEVTVGLQSSPALVQRAALLAVPAERGRQQSAFEVALPLAGVAPGATAVEVTARLPDGRIATRVVPIQMLRTRGAGRIYNR
jgi:hypothetical protein